MYYEKNFTNYLLCGDWICLEVSQSVVEMVKFLPHL